MKKALLQLLLSLGAEQAIIDKLQADIDKDDAVIPDDLKTQITDMVRGTMRTALENDSDFMEGIRSAERGKQKDIFDRKLKQKFGLTAEEIKDKKSEELIDLAHKKSTATGSAEVQQLQQELAAANEKLEKYDTEIIPGIKNENAAQRKKERIDLAVQNLITDMATRKEGKALRVKPEAAIAVAREYIANGYDVDIDDNGNLTVTLKGQAGIKPMNKDKTKTLGVADLLEGRFDELEFMKASNGGTPAKPVKGAETIDEDDDAKKNEGKNMLQADAATKHLAEIKAKSKPKE